MKKKLQKKSKKERSIWSRLISRVFDPIIVIPVMLVLVVLNAVLNGYAIRFLVFLIILDVVLPGVVLFLFIRKDVVLSGWDVEKREERVPLFWFVVINHLVGVLAAWFLGKHPLTEYLFIFWVLTVIYAILTHFWKISVHVGVMSAMATFVVYLYGAGFWWMYLFVLVVAWARVEGKFHRWGQVLGGLLLPILIVNFGLWRLVG